MVMANISSISPAKDTTKIRRQIFRSLFTILIGFILALFLFDWFSPRLMEYLEAHNPRIFMDEARNLAADGKYSEAVEQINRAIKITPSDSNLYIILGDYYKQMEKFNESIVAYEKAKQLNPKDYHVYFRLGEVKRKMKQLPESVADLLDAAKLNKDDRWLYNELGWAAYENNQLDIAYNAWTQANHIVPNEPSYYYILALIDTRRKQWAQALDMYNKVIALDSTQTNAYELAGEAQFQSGDLASAEKYWNQALSLNPNSTTALYGLATVYRNMGNKIKENQINEEIRKIKPASP
jgi:tetratricopeptide (TPR) repeat protein